ncbi:sensor histidine kinase [Glycomyces sp. NRRL B-16210]|uniref:sensor histidine kinase n=1 Tax=Glycomyces sp. NRRL B-16210 TaxID=1463821 RepID=UPI0004C05B17|nr:histidine kinase [Glycomyces sp. NRRL B-16210]
MAEAVTFSRKRGLWQRMWEFDSRHPLLWDLFPIVLYAVPAATATVASAAGAFQQRYPAMQALVVVLLLVPTVWRRRYPFAVTLSQLVPVAITTPLGLTGAGAEFADSAGAIAFTVVLYNLVLRRPLRFIWWAALISAATAGFDWWLRYEHSVMGFVALFAPTAFYFGFVVAVALLVRTRRDFQRSEREQAAREAVAEERTRIAREMHDIIGHNLAVINALADGGAYAAAAAPERAKEALEVIGKTSREALGELRRVLSVLKAEDGDEVAMAPQPGLADLEALVERVREAGLPVTVRTSGERGELSENLQLAVYRTVQESLTNVLKHATGPRWAEVRLDYGDEGLDVVVSNTGDRVEAAGTQRGLAGLGERAAAFGGTMVAGPEAGGGWRVVLRLPREGKGRR